MLQGGRLLQLVRPADYLRAGVVLQKARGHSSRPRGLVCERCAHGPRAVCVLWHNNIGPDLDLARSSLGVRGPPATCHSSSLTVVTFPPPESAEADPAPWQREEKGQLDVQLEVRPPHTSEACGLRAGITPWGRR